MLLPILLSVFLPMNDSASSFQLHISSSTDSDPTSNDPDESSLDQQSVNTFPPIISLYLHSRSFNPHVSIPDQNSMSESTKHCEIGESNNLQGLQNYTIWKIKMEAIFRREKLWSIVETKWSDLVFPTMIEGIVFPIEDRFRSKK